jgi:hypothetical protein
MKMVKLRKPDGACEFRPTPITESCVIHPHGGGALKSSIIIARCNVTLHLGNFLIPEKRGKQPGRWIFGGIQGNSHHSKPPVFSYQIALSKKSKPITDGDLSSGDQP